MEEAKPVPGPKTIPFCVKLLDAEGSASKSATLSIRLPIPPNSSLSSVGEDGPVIKKGRTKAPLNQFVISLEDLIKPEGDKAKLEWQKKALVDRPNIKELRERLVKETLTNDRVLELIMQHLTIEGLRASRKAIQEESGIQYTHRELEASRLVQYLHDAIKAQDRVLELTKRVDEDAQAQLVEHLLQLGLENADDMDAEPDVDIWAEVPEGVEIIQTRPGFDPSVLENVMSATLNKLVELLTASQTGDTVDQLKFTKTFLMTYRSFTSGERVLAKLIQRFNVPAKHSTHKLPIQLRVVNVLRYWVENYWSDWTSKLRRQLAAFLESMPPKLAQKVQAGIDKMLNSSGTEVVLALDARLSQAPDPKIPKNIWSPTLILFDVDEEEIARQMTLIDFAIFAKITPAEFLNCAWMNPKLRHRAHNVLTIKQRHADIVAWTAYSIASAKGGRMLSKFINLAWHLRTIGNFDSCQAILSGIQKTKSLRSAWDEVQKREISLLEQLEALLAPLDRYDTYRTVLQQQPPPKIPFLELVLNDLVAIETRYPATDERSGAMVNFQKRRMIYDLVSGLLQYQQDPFIFMEVYQIKQFLVKVPVVDQRQLTQLLVKSESTSDLTRRDSRRAMPYTSVL